MPATLIGSIYRGWDRGESYWDTIGMNENLKFIGDHLPSLRVIAVDPDSIPSNPQQGSAILHTSTGQYRVYSKNANNNSSGWTLYPASKGMVTFFNEKFYGNTGYSWFTAKSNAVPVSTLPPAAPEVTVGAPVNMSLTNIYFTDPDGDELTYIGSGFPPGITMSTSGIISGAATAAGRYTVVITARDGNGGSVTSSSIWVVLPATSTNRPPTSTFPASVPDSGVGGYVGLIELSQWFSDPDGDPLTYTVTGLPPGITYSNGVITGTPTTAGVFTVSVTANDGRGGSITDTTSWTVQPAVATNNPPTSTFPASVPDSGVGGYVGLIQLSQWFTDPDGDPLTYTVSGLPPGITYANGVITGTPTTAGVFTVSVTANDGRGGSITRTTSWTVQPAVATNNPPTSTMPSTFGPSYINSYNEFSIAQYFSDPDGDPLTFTSTGLPSGVVCSSAGIVSGTTPSTTGVYPVSFTANDGRGGSITRTAQWSITLIPNRAPTSTFPPSVPDSGVGNYVGLIDLNQWFSDPDGDPLTYTVTGLPPGITHSNGVITGTPTTAGVFTVSVTANDGRGGSITDTTSWTVQP